MKEIKTRIVYGCIFYTIGMAVFCILRLLFDSGKAVAPSVCLMILGLVAVLETADGLIAQIPFKHKLTFYLSNFSILYVVFIGYMLLWGSSGLDWQSVLTNTLFFAAGYIVINRCLVSIQLRNVRRINEKLI